jgi:hypothetical protein
MEWCIIATSCARLADHGQPLQKIMALSALSYIGGGYASLSIIEAHLVVRKNVHQRVGTLLLKPYNLLWYEDGNGHDSAAQGRAKAGSCCS